ncbi:MAG: F0F1 ATP synthase subunit B' [Alphaproteobacteria bacterium]|nr:F0F1 ATP synthase subunit B' [Alphaproteobacteria bacterium]
MPQLDISTFAPQIFWLVIWFGILYVIMSKVALPRMAVAIDGRKRQREGDLARAVQLKAEAEAAHAAFQRTMAEARAEAQAILKQASDRMATEAGERQHVLAGQLTQKIEEAERRIAASKSQALADMRGVAVDVGRAVVEKLTGTPPDDHRLGAVVDGLLARQVH